MHLEKQSYDKAVENIRTIFQSIRMQYQKIMETMYRIRKNALEYSVEEYKALLDENLDTIRETKDKFQSYKELVRQRINEYESREIQLSSLSEADTEQLRNLRTISDYLGMVIEEHQKILGRHMDLKQLYTKELEALTEVAHIKRFSLRNEVYEKILDNPSALENLNLLLSPLICADISKIYSPSISLKPHKILRKRAEESITESIDFDEEAWEAEQERIRAEKRKVYESSLCYIIERCLAFERVRLSEMKKDIDEDSSALFRLIPSIDVFKEIMVELIRAQHIDIQALKAERKNVLGESTEIFELNYMLLEILEKINGGEKVRHIDIEKLPDSEMVVFENVTDANGNIRNIRCSEIQITIIRG